MPKPTTPDDIREVLTARRVQRLEAARARVRHTRLMMLVVIPAVGALIAAVIARLLHEYSLGALLVTAVVVYVTSAISGYLLMGCTRSNDEDRFF